MSSAILRAVVAFGAGLFLEFVAATLISPIWVKVESPGAMLANTAIGAVFAFGAGVIAALIAGALAIHIVTALIVIFVAYAALLMTAEVVTALVLMLVLPASTLAGLLIVTRRRGRLQASEAPTASGADGAS